MTMNHTVQHAHQMGEALWSDLKNAKSESCVTGVFAGLAGDTGFSELKAAAKGPRRDGQMVVDGFRDGCRNIYDHCGIWRHSLKKPYGYAGDFAILEHVYDNSPHEWTRTPLGEVLDVWALKTVLPNAVRDRKDTLRVLIERFCEKKRPSPGRPLRVLSVGSGAARELREVDDSCLDLLDVTLIDSDPMPLEYAKACLGGHRVKTIAANIFKLNRSSVGLVSGSFDLVYSFGVVDYLSNALAIRLLSSAASLLKENGTMLFCLKDTKHYSPWFYDWFYNWSFVPRTIDDAQTLAAASGLKIQRTFLVENRAVGIFECKKTPEPGTYKGSP